MNAAMSSLKYETKPNESVKSQKVTPFQRHSKKLSKYPIPVLTLHAKQTSLLTTTTEPSFKKRTKSKIHHWIQINLHQRSCRDSYCDRGKNIIMSIF